VGDVSVKYNGKKVAGAFLMGQTAALEMTSELVAQEAVSGPMAKTSVSARLPAGPRQAEDLFGTEDPIGKDVK